MGRVDINKTCAHITLLLSQQKKAFLLTQIRKLLYILYIYIYIKVTSSKHMTQRNGRVTAIFENACFVQCV